jgi:two-component system, OmpR family, sensor histidine kinase ArlS
MKIRTKIALQFTLIVATILVIFSVSLYYLLESYTRKEFNNYLVDLSTLYAADVLVFNDNNEVAYSNYEADTIYYNPQLLEKVRKEKFYESTYKDKEVVGLMYKNEESQNYLILAQSEDVYGKQKLENIRDAMTIGLLSAILLTIVFGFIFSGQSLKPISRINQEVSKITAYNLTKKLSTGNNKDEIAQLARNFNEMLSRIERSFELQKSFVSNASHELRTPLAAIKSEIQVALEKERNSTEYQHILKTLYIDNQRLIQLTNGLLQLAKSEKGDESVQLSPIRIDEVLFEVQDELMHQHTNYQIAIDFEEIPEDDNWVTVLGNKPLLKTVFNNLFDNACKYSEDKLATVNIRFNRRNCIVMVSDKGIGIPNDELDKVFEPFYRTKNASSFKGHGIGLSICKRIIDMHKGRIVVKSEVGEGSTFNIILPHI